MMRFGWTSLAVALVAIGPGLPAARAGIVVEAEQDGQAINNTRQTAQVIADGAFTLPVPANVFLNLPTATIQGRGGRDDVDFYSFRTAGGTTLFDIDNNPFTFDTIVSVFNSAGTLIAFDDDSGPADPGSAEPTDSYLGAVNLAAGTYFVAVSRFTAVESFGNFANQTFAPGVTYQGLTRPDGQFGGQTTAGTAIGDSSFASSGNQTGGTYTLQISTTPVPEPAGLVLLGAGLAGVLLAGRRRVGQAP